MDVTSYKLSDFVGFFNVWRTLEEGVVVGGHGLEPWTR